ncbi:MAG: hypothetical protein ACI4BC_07965, partial [Muribaculaceae bacterium]
CRRKPTGAGDGVWVRTRSALSTREGSLTLACGLVCALREQRRGEALWVLGVYLWHTFYLLC